MTFNSFEFGMFLIVVLVLYQRVPLRWQNGLLVAASYFFYGWWDYRFLGLLALSTVVDFSVGRAMGRAQEERTRRALLAVSLVTNLGILATFKYAGFFVDSFQRLLGGLGLDVASPILHVVLPVGISFYTFQTLSYTFDVFRRRMDPERSFVTFAAYVAYFPQLVAGPIERARRLLPQLNRPRPPITLSALRAGGVLILSGLFKKVVLADGIAPLVNERFSDPSAHGPLSLLLGLYAFSIQVYGDFSGYSSIARGVSRLFGIELMRNFEQPFLSRSITQFWRTWHISLSTWLHDYLYVPLGGNQRGRLLTYRNLMLTMLLGGLWHGAGWTYVVFGALHGAYLSIDRLMGVREPRGKPEPPRARDIPAIVGTFHLVSAGWILFRADSISVSWEYLRGLFRLTDLTASTGSIEAAATLVGLFALAMLAHDLVDRNRTTWVPRLAQPALAGAGLAVAVVAVFVWSGAAPEPFIYFQF